MSPRRRTNHGSPDVHSGNSATHGEVIQAKKSFPLSRTILAGLLVFYIVFPLALHFSTSCQRAVVYLTYVAPPSLILNLSDTSGFEPEHVVRRFKLETSEPGHMGAWHISSRGDSLSTSSDSETSLSDGRPVFLYFHGNAGNRGIKHRVQLYKLLSKIDCHVIAVDYRGFGDSSFLWPTNETVVSDAVDTYRWARRHATGPVLLWGHSLGSGISVQTASLACSQGVCPNGVVLESAFTSVESAATTHPIGRPWMWILQVLPSLRETYFQRWTEQLNSLAKISDVTCPLLLLHSEDDSYISYKDSHALASRAKESRMDQSTVEYHLLDGYGHNHICRHPQLGSIVRQFVSGLVKDSSSPSQ